MGVIYKITSPSNRVYIGQTYDLRKRINSHKHNATRYGKTILLYNSIRKYGWDAHILEIVEHVDDTLLDEREIFWITELKTYCYDNSMGLNMTKGGLGHRSTWMHKTELRKQFSDMFSGEGNPFFGKKHSDESKKIMGEKAYERSMKSGRTIPQWGADKGRLKVIQPIILYNSKGELLFEFGSFTDCANYLKIDVGTVTSALKRDSWIKAEYKVRRKLNIVPDKIDVDNVRVYNVKRPVLILSDDFEPMAEYDSAKEASDFWGIPKGSINRNAMEFRLLKTGHNFMYKDIYEDLMAA
jgi:group I intron endonuclease